MKMMKMDWDDPYPENERSKDLDHNMKKSDHERGFIRDDKDFYEPGDYERKDEYGMVVTHQDSRTLPKRNSCC